MHTLTAKTHIAPSGSELRRTTRIALAVVSASALALTAAACGGGGSDDGGKKSTAPATSASAGGSGGDALQLPDLHGQKLEVAAVWTGPEQKNFQKVLDEFDKRTGAKTTFVPTGDSQSTFLGTKIQGGAPPDVAFLAQNGVLHQFADKGWLKPLGAEAQAQLSKNFSPGWQQLGAWKGKQYGIYAKVSNKSLIWYNAAAFSNAGATEPKTWADFLKTAETVFESGTPPVSIGGADGWTLTDWFENIYLSQAGPEKYDQLAAHKIKWTDPSVKDALTTLGQLFGAKDLIAGGAKGALGTDFPKSVTQTFGGTPAAAMVYEGDFVSAFISANTKAKVGTDAKEFAFPAVGTGKAPVVSGGDVGVALKDGPGAQALLTFIASTDAAKIWAQGGGYLSPNKSLDMAAYPDDVQRNIAKSLIAAGDDFRFDMSDQAPAAFGGTKGEGEWKDLQDFLAKPSDVAGAQAKLEADAAKAYGS
ncbi:extracellular solute-binding protein [Streptomyces cocklensis]|jgi:multiple sugar transport system substrate-binding protein/alpha-glucoside transport system substrate-binding protein|uniref:Alpha-glucosides-binding periplasmic protein AglE n=1 Tax=Actinacidiphila cocklensis TaxID=887465 RepID=A0A9W4GTP7_9ACTN|nr:extracellular solute-binding protein [Actinacidiphila cocklensis]MDD1058361.1 extracellular solute-binding protein [Actinacidiphila cocklensis]WSX79242.1 extracellular solute-binding protein [Streptomyces sp. NBC_00899]CAG6396744.1 Alpha-glucosides-binding periplasmic protein AglE precursor [Actinacidiphila cocklensis]